MALNLYLDDCANAGLLANLLTQAGHTVVRPGDVGMRGAVGVDFGGPEVPAHLELVGHVVVELLGGLGYGVFDDGAGGVFSAVVVDVDALVSGGFAEADGVDGGCGDTLVSTDEGELTHHRDEGVGKGFEAEVGEPEA